MATMHHTNDDANVQEKDIETNNEMDDKNQSIIDDKPLEKKRSNVAAFGDVDSELWVGDFPSSFNRKSFLLHFQQLTPFGIPRGDIRVKTFNSKRYRLHDTKKWAGYAIIQCGTQESAQRILKEMNGTASTFKGTDFKFRVQPAKNDPEKEKARKKILEPGQHPVLYAQLAAMQEDDMDAKLLILKPNEPVPDTWKAKLNALLEYYEAIPRTIETLQGHPVPEALTTKLFNTLESVNFPRGSHRESVMSQFYVVLKTNKMIAGFEQLSQDCREFMNWVDAPFPYTAIAITKNFTGSPHIDLMDQCPQYCISLGDFTDGGELCVDSNDPKKILQVDTRNKVAKVDGRYVHWVRGYSGNRYSLIFYCSDVNYYTPRAEPYLGFSKTDAES